YDESEEEEEEEEQFDDTVGVSVETAEAASFAWNLIRTRRFEKEDMHEGVRNLMGLFWFPGLKGKPPTLTNIVNVLVELLRTGLWSEKCEASKALLFLFHTFRGDFLDPMTTLVRPQLEVLGDESWQVRAQICNNILGYGTFHPDIIHGLICRLADEHEHVRKCAMNALGHFGVNNQHTLRAAMMQVGMLPAGPQVVPSVPWLDELIADAERTQTQYQIDHHNFILRWLASVDERFFSTLRRTNSYYQHLAGKFFPPDAKGFHLPRPSVTLLQTIARAQTSGTATAVLGSRRRPPGKTGIYFIEEEYDEEEGGESFGMDDGVMAGWDVRSEVSRTSVIGGAGAQQQGEGRVGSGSQRPSQVARRTSRVYQYQPSLAETGNEYGGGGKRPRSGGMYHSGISLTPAAAAAGASGRATSASPTSRATLASALARVRPMTAGKAHALRRPGTAATVSPGQRVDSG
ncbi:hypothetical protein HK104_006380, partial [Borealophlyctis nickersoniae]